MSETLRRGQKKKKWLERLTLGSKINQLVPESQIEEGGPLYLQFHLVCYVGSSLPYVYTFWYVAF